MVDGGVESLVDILELTSSEQLIFILKMYLSLFYKTSYLNEEVNHYEQRFFHGYEPVKQI